MKTKRNIRERITKVSQKYKEKINEFQGMSEELKGSKEGAELFGEISRLEGVLMAFKWILEK